MDTYYAIILVLIILVIGYYMYSSGSSATNNNNPGGNGNPGGNPGPGPGPDPGPGGNVCTGNQICMDVCGGSLNPTSMFEFIFEYVHGGSYAVFDDVVQQPNSVNQNHFMIIEDTSKKSAGSGIIYQYFIPSSPSIPFWGGSALWNITSASGVPYAMLICPSTYNAATNGNTISKYLGIVVNYSFNDSSIAYTKENVANPNNTKSILPTITGKQSGVTTSTYLGVCDLTPWFSSLSAADQALVGVYSDAATQVIRLNGAVCDNMTTSDINFVGDTSMSVFRNVAPNNHPYGVTIFSYTLNAQTFTPPPYPSFSPALNDIGVTYL